MDIERPYMRGEEPLFDGVRRIRIETVSEFGNDVDRLSDYIRSIEEQCADELAARQAMEKEE